MISTGNSQSEKAVESSSYCAIGVQHFGIWLAIEVLNLRVFYDLLAILGIKLRDVLHNGKSNDVENSAVVYMAS